MEEEEGERRRGEEKGRGKGGLTFIAAIAGARSWGHFFTFVAGEGEREREKMEAEIGIWGWGKGNSG